MKKEVVIDNDNKKVVETYNDYGILIRRDVYTWSGDDRNNNHDRHDHRYETYDKHYGGNGGHFENTSKEDRKIAGKLFNNKK